MKTVKKAWRRELRTIEEHTYCDICGEDCNAQVKKHTGDGGLYDMTEVEIEAKVGQTWPDGSDDRTCYEIDVCIICFLEKVRPAVEALGCKFREHDNPYKTIYQKEEIVEADGS